MTETSTTLEERLQEVLTDHERVKALDGRATLQDVIDPVLDSLGWTAGDSRKVEGGGYLLLLDGDRQAYIETKPAHIELNQEHEVHLQRCVSDLDVPFAVLTNGIEWRLFLVQAPATWLEGHFATVVVAPSESIKLSVVARRIAAQLQAVLARLAFHDGSALRLAEEAREQQCRDEQIDEFLFEHWFPAEESLLYQLQEHEPLHCHPLTVEELRRRLLCRLVQLVPKSGSPLTEAPWSAPSQSAFQARSIRQLKFGDVQCATNSSADALLKFWELMLDELGEPDFSALVRHNHAQLYSLIRRSTGNGARFHDGTQHERLRSTDYVVNLQFNTDTCVTNMRRICLAFGQNPDKLEIEVA